MIFGHSLDHHNFPDKWGWHLWIMETSAQYGKEKIQVTSVSIFSGAGRLQYVIFKRRPGSRRISRTAGIDTVEGIKKQIGAFDLMSLVNA